MYSSRNKFPFQVFARDGITIAPADNLPAHFSPAVVSITPGVHCRFSDGNGFPFIFSNTVERVPPKHRIGRRTRISREALYGYCKEAYKGRDPLSGRFRVVSNGVHDWKVYRIDGDEVTCIDGAISEHHSGQFVLRQLLGTDCSGTTFLADGLCAAATHDGTAYIACAD